MELIREILFKDTTNRFDNLPAWEDLILDGKKHEVVLRWKELHGIHMTVDSIECTSKGFLNFMDVRAKDFTHEGTLMMYGFEENK